MNIDLHKEMRKELERLKERSITEGKRLIKARGAKNIFIGDAYQNIQLDPEVIVVLSTEMHFNPKYSISAPTTILELIYACDGINNTIMQLHYFQRSDLKDFPTHIINYIDTLEQNLSFAKSCTYEKPSSPLRMPLPFCALCWKHTSSSKYYCREHNPSLNLANHKKAKNQLFTAIKTTSSDEDVLEKYYLYKKGYFKGHQLAPTLYGWTASFAPRAKILIISNETDADTTKATIDLIVATIKNNYPRTTSRLANFFKGKSTLNLQSWVIQIIGILDSTYLIWKHKDDGRWTKESSQQDILQTLLNFLLRHEAFLVIQNAKSIYGPKKGSNADLGLRQDIQQLLAKQMQEKGKVNQSEIARKLGLSRQRISVLMKEINSNT